MLQQLQGQLDRLGCHPWGINFLGSIRAQINQIFHPLATTVDNWMANLLTRLIRDRCFAEFQAIPRDVLLIQQIFVGAVKHDLDLAYAMIQSGYLDAVYRYLRTKREQDSMDENILQEISGSLNPRLLSTILTSLFQRKIGLRFDDRLTLPGLVRIQLGDDVKGIEPWYESGYLRKAVEMQPDLIHDFWRSREASYKGNPFSIFSRGARSKLAAYLTQIVQEFEKPSPRAPPPSPLPAATPTTPMTTPTTP